MPPPSPPAQALELPGAPSIRRPRSRSAAADAPATRRVTPRQIDIGTKRSPLPGLLPVVGDVIGAAIALTAIAVFGGGLQPATTLLAPALFVCLNCAAGHYRLSGAEPLVSRRIVLDLLLTSALFAWSGLLLSGSADGGANLGPAAQAALWLGVFAVGLESRVAADVLRRRLGPVRWLVVGDPRAAWRLRRSLGDDSPVDVVAASALPVNGFAAPDGRSEALEALQRYDVDRVVLAPGGSDPQEALGLIRTFKSVGVDVSVLSPLVDVFEEVPGESNLACGISVIDVGPLTVNGDGNGHAKVAGGHRTAARKGRPRVSVVLMTLNEAANLPWVFDHMPVGLHEVILVDGGSTDGTVEVAKDLWPGIRVLQQTGHGKGDAMRTGFAAVTGDIVVTLDADGSADPGEIPLFVEALVAGADFAKGSRFASGGGSEDITRLRQLGNWALNTTANLLYGTRYSDLCYGYNAFWTHCLPYIALDVPGFEVETLMNLRVANAGLKVTEVPSFEAKRLHGQTHLSTFRDGFRVLRTILGERNWNVPTHR
jgi:Glycosyl transferase family 2